MQTLERVHCFEYSAFTIIRSKVVSPLHHRVARGERAGVQVCFTTETVGQANFKGLLEWQASRGFGEVPEAIVRKVHKDCGLPELREQEPKQESEAVLEVARHFNPDLTKEEARHLLCKRHETDCPDVALGGLDCEMLRDVILPKDHDDIIHLASGHAETKEKRRAQNKEVPPLVARHFCRESHVRCSQGQSQGG